MACMVARCRLMLAFASLVQDSGVYSNLGAHLRRTDRMPESRATYAAAIRADPKNAEAYIGLGKCFTAPAGAFSSVAKAGDQLGAGFVRACNISLICFSPFTPTTTCPTCGIADT